MIISWGSVEGNSHVHEFHIFYVISASLRSVHKKNIIDIFLNLAIIHVLYILQVDPMDSVYIRSKKQCSAAKRL